MEFVTGAATIVLLFRWIRGLIVYFTRRDEYEKIIKTEMYNGDEGVTKKVSVKNQLFFSYPLGIVIFGLLTYGSFVWRG